MERINQWRAPYLSYEKIDAACESFRARTCGRYGFPLNIELVAEKELHLELIPVAGIRRLARISAFVRSDFSAIVVDLEELTDERWEPHMRFSIAHEIGHYVMHQDLYKQFQVEDIEDYITLIQNLSEQAYRAIELQANRFAGVLLVPRARLGEELRTARQRGRTEIPSVYRNDPEMSLQWIAPSVGRSFGVSPRVIERRTRDEGLIQEGM